MYLPTKFTRTAAAGAFWTADTLPTAAPSNQDFLLPARNRNILGWPIHRVAVGYSGPAGATYLRADLYAWDVNTQLYYLTHDMSKMLRPGRINYFDVPAICEPPQTQANQGNAISDGIGLILIVTPPNVTAVNGTYTFTMAADLTTIGTEEPNPDDEGNGLQLIVPNDGADNLSMPYGPCRWIWCQVSGNLAFAAVDDSDAGKVTLAMVAGTKYPFRVRKVFATTTTGTYYAAY